MPDIKTPSDITVECMNHFFKKLETRKRVVGRGEVRIGVKASTIMTYWSKLNSFFVWLEGNGYLEVNPLPKVRPAEPEYRDIKALSKSELEKIIGAIDLHSSNTLIFKRDKAMVYLLFSTGIRRGELRSLRVMDVDLNKGIIRICGDTSKSKKTRELPISPILDMHLREYISERNKRGYKSEYFIVSNNGDGALSNHGLKHWVNKIRSNSGVVFHLHQFRHSFACAMAKVGASSYELQKAMGHTDLRMTDRYLRSLGVEDVRDRMNKLSIENLA
tara:strand:- start:220 stop:1041 length:822 start_codon:yes stop_codon:yes gene_type:complete